MGAWHVIQADCCSWPCSTSGPHALALTEEAKKHLEAMGEQRSSTHRRVAGVSERLSRAVVSHARARIVYLKIIQFEPQRPNLKGSLYPQWGQVRQGDPTISVHWSHSLWPLPTGGPLILLLGDAEGDCERGTATPSATTAAVRLLPRPGLARRTCVV